MVVNRRPDRDLAGGAGRPVGEDLLIEGDFAVDGNLVYCKMQVTGLQYFLHLSIPFIGSRCVATNDKRSSTME